MPDTLLMLFIAYYVVGVIHFVREVRAIPDDDPSVVMFNHHMDTESNSQVLWSAIKLLLYVVVIHVPCWIFRV